jgi:HlyD family secretion protein
MTDLEIAASRAASAASDLNKALASEEGGRVWLRRLALVAVIAIAVGGGFSWRVKHRPAAPAKYVTVEVAAGDVTEKVQATGAVQPLLQVSVGAQANGRVTRVLVDFNSVVHKGDVLAEIDPTFYGAQVSQASANVQAQRAQLESAKASATAARVTFERIERLQAQNLSSKGDVDTAKGQYDVALANVESARAAIGSTQAQLTQSQTNIGYTKIYSPVDGLVITRNIDPGATVVASFQAPVLFVIAQDLRKMRVMADVDEADVGRLKEGMDADAVVDAFPGESFQGRVQQVRYSPNNVSGVVTYSAVIEVENPDEKLRPGMTATVTIKTREAKGVLKVPNAALRYKPSPPVGPDGKPVLPPAEAPLGKGQGRVYLLTSDKPGEEKADGKLVAVGVTDGVSTEVRDATLILGTKVVTDETDDDKKKKKGPF